MGKMKVLGVTGGCGPGKSTVSRLLAQQGGPVIDADRLTRRLQEPGKPVYREIVQWLGTDFLLPDGQLDRRKIAAVVFHDQVFRNRLNEIVHGRVADSIQTEIAEIEKREQQGFIVLDVPIPVERGFLDTADVIWAVVANYDIRIQRLVDRMGISRQEAISRIDSQLSNEQYEAIADVVIENEQGIDQLRRCVEEALSRFFL